MILFNIESLNKTTIASEKCCLKCALIGLKRNNISTSARQ